MWNTLRMAIEVLVTAEFKEWWDGLSEEEQTGDGRWYEKYVPKAEKLLAAYLEETGQNG